MQTPSPSVLKRACILGTTGCKLYLQYQWVRLTLPKERINEVMAQKLRLDVQRLGPTFIKLAQWLSLRSELLPKEICESFEVFFDHATAIPQERVRELVEKELKQQLGDVYLEFSEKPIGVASIGQVHYGKLLDGTEVAIKVQKPGIQQVIADDIACLMFLARQFHRNPKHRPYDFPGLVKELNNAMKKELDFMNEGQACDRFRQNQENEDNVHVPEIFWECTTKRLLTMEFIRGYKVYDIMKAVESNDREYLERLRTENINLDQVCDFVIYNYFKQNIVDGFFHADLHPSNILLLENGRICYLDFGIMGELTPKVLCVSMLFFRSIVLYDPEGVIQAFEKLGKRIPMQERLEMKHFVRLRMDMLRTYSLSEYSLSQMCYDIIVEAAKRNISIPSSLFLCVKGMATLDGTARKLSPNFDYEKSSQNAFRRVSLLNQIQQQPDLSSYSSFALDMLLLNFSEFARNVNKLLTY